MGSGIVAFLCVEKFVRIYSAGGHSHSHSHVQPADDSKKDDEKDKKLEKESKSDGKEDDDKVAEDDDDNTETGSDHENAEAVKNNSSTDSTEETHEDIQVSGYLNLAADAFHNFTDGLAIGASFMAGNPVGWMTTLSILFHEIPHEIGDYAILIQSGVPPLKAIFMQSLTAIAALAGCLVALFAQSAGQAAAQGIILPFTAGGFIYIATVSVIPDLLEGTTLIQSVME